MFESNGEPYQLEHPPVRDAPSHQRHEVAVVDALGPGPWVSPRAVVFRLPSEYIDAAPAAGRYVPPCNRRPRSARNPSTPSCSTAASVIASIPAAPRFALTRHHASHRTSRL